MEIISLVTTAKLTKAMKPFWVRAQLNSDACMVDSVALMCIFKDTGDIFVELYSELSVCEFLDGNTAQLLKLLLCCSVVLNLFICITIGE